MDQKIKKTLLNDLGLADLPQDKKDRLIIKMTEALLKRMFVETMDKLNVEDQDAYGKMIDKGASPDEVEKFLRGKISDYDRLLEKVVTDFRSEMLKTAN